MGAFHILKKIVIFPVIICSLEYTKNILYDVRRGKHVYSQTSSINFRNYRILEGSRKQFDVDYFYDSAVSIENLEDDDEEYGETQSIPRNKNTKQVYNGTEEYRKKMKNKGAEMLKNDLDCGDIMSCNYPYGNNIIDDNKVTITDDNLDDLELTNDYRYNNKQYDPALSIYQDSSLIKPNVSSKYELSKQLRTGGRNILDIDIQKYEEEYNKFILQEYKNNKHNDLTIKELKKKFMDVAVNIVIGILIIGTIGPAFPFMLIRKEKIDAQVKNMWKFYKNIFTGEHQKK
ncbi:fam-b protein [Plasmodium vinckei brucechwatti]|uniref:Fam-b protein n=1 Tax=Plasmodium vinckei brucechwatti TaxID=119398 RepID=A0A6V7RU11_PLAVN|nr:fam-b protein [Plasmodium vinckei brucechwatti]